MASNPPTQWGDGDFEAFLDSTPPDPIQPPEHLLFQHVTAPGADPRPTVIAPFMRRGDFTMLTGAMGEGKTALLADMAFSAGVCSYLPNEFHALAGAFRVNWHVLNAKRVVILDAENDRSEWKDLLLQSARARDLDPLEPGLFNLMGDQIRWTSASNWSFSPRNARDTTKRLVDALIELDCGVLIIDPLHALLGIRDQNASGWVFDTLRPLRMALKQTQITTLAVVHTSRGHKDKLDENLFNPSGTSEQEKMCDHLFGIKRNKKNNTFNLRLVKRRSAKWIHEGHNIRLHGTGLHAGFLLAENIWSFTDDSTAPLTIRLSPNELHLLNSLPKDKEFTFADVKGHKSTITHTFKSLLEPAGYVKHVRGEGKKGSPKVWKAYSPPLALKDRSHSYEA